MIRIDPSLAVIVCAGPSLDRLGSRAWRDLADAGALVSINGALAAEACADVRFTYASAMDASLGLTQHVPRFRELWESTPAWRLTCVEAPPLTRRFAPPSPRARGEGQRGVGGPSPRVRGEGGRRPDEGRTIRVRELDERDGVEGWADDEDAGYAGGSSAMVTVNWICNQWRTGNPACPRGFRRVAFLGLDMVPGQGGHARGAGTHTSGFALSAERHANVSRGWEKVCRQASRRGIEIVNLTPGTGLETMPRAEVPPAWR